MALVLESCPGGVQKPPVTVPLPVGPPAVHQVRISVFEGDPALDHKAVGAQVAIGDHVVTAGSTGDALVTLAKGTYALTVEADGYESFAQSVVIANDQVVNVSLMPRPPPSRVATMRGKLVISGRQFFYPDGVKFTWVGITGFQLLEMVAHGREAEAVAYLAWARGQGFNMVRVLAMASGLFRLSPTEGQTALPRLAELAQREDLYLEIVALADTRAYNMSRAAIEAHVAAVGRVAAETPNVVLELANENAHPTQVSDLQDLAWLRSLHSIVPVTLLTSLGSSCCDQGDEAEVYPGGDFIGLHLDRGRDPWNMIRRVRELENVSSSVNKPVVNDEPIGADETLQPGKRLPDPPIFLTMGVLGRIFDVPTTFHCQDCIYGRIPGPVQQACAVAFLEGMQVVPLEARLSFVNAGWAGSPVVKAAFSEAPLAANTTVRAYSGLLTSSAGILALVGVQGDPRVEWGSGWSSTGVLLEKPGIRVVKIQRAATASAPEEWWTSLPAKVAMLRMWR